MGNCASSQYTSEGGNLSWKSSVNVIDMEGKLQQLKETKKAGHVLSQNLNCFMCSSESMYIGSPIPHVDPSEELQLGHIYFLLPLSKSYGTLSLQDLCALAIKANAALVHSHTPSAANSTASATYSISRKSFSLKHKNLVNNSGLPCVSLRV
ncbi:uncharacterized protein LOC114733317 [Neltuma alba]|uniref:uncharacterized protein LOC114733317 n=1 Tax=Neltuma alba TaxID=207710 RepID=UPI0010A4504D|nr:uncharacterized protein LOC114733317 [Prosopis alba]